MRLEPMGLQVIRSPKHKGAIFLKLRNTKDSFVCKIYPQKTECLTTEIANRIVTMCNNFEGIKEQENVSTSKE
jgi:hypothetical protein